MRSVMIVRGETNLLAQHGLNSRRVNLGLSVKDRSDAINKAAGGTRDSKESSVEHFDLLFGIA